MPNFTKVCNGTKIEDALCWTADLDHRGILSLVTNIPLSIVAFLGNAFIIAALRKVSCCHPPSKVLLGGLACTDLCIGLITQPLHVTYKLCKWFSEHSNHCVHLLDASMSMSLRRVQFSIASSWLLNGGEKNHFFRLVSYVSPVLQCYYVSLSQHAVTQKFSTDFVAKKCKSIAIFNKDSRKLGWKPC